MRASARYRVVVATSLLALVGMIAPPALAKDGGGLRLAGRLPLQMNDYDDRGHTPRMMDPEGRRLYVSHRTRTQQFLTEYDLSPAIPRIVRDVPFELLGPLNGPSTHSFDVAHRRVFVLDIDAGGTYSMCPGCSLVRLLNLDALRFEATFWNLSTTVPNFYAEGITYSAGDDTLYAVGTITGYGAFYLNAIYVPPPVIPVTVIALDARTGAVRWVHMLRKCQRSMSTYGNGAAIFRSRFLDALYLSCLRADASGFGVPSPGQSGLMRLWMDPGSDIARAQTFREEFFPISGTYTSVAGVSGITGFDPVSDRVLLVSQSGSTPGAWVFDGHLPGWVGFIPADNSTTQALGVNVRTGHVYLKSGRRIIVSDVRGTPIPQGSSYEYPSPNLPQAIFADPFQNRAFMRAESGGGIPVLVDETPDAARPDPVRYDDLTVDIPEGPGTAEDYSGTANGFGVRVNLVGGWGGVLSPFRPVGVGKYVAIPNVSPGDRGVVAGYVPSLDVRNVGASASAQAVSPDTLTAEDVRNRQNDVRGAGEANDQREVGTSLADRLHWPWGSATCLDADGSKPLQETGEGPAGSSAHVICDLSKSEATATSSVGGVSGAGIAVAAAGVSAAARRDPKEGMVTDVVSFARGIEIGVPGGGTLSIGQASWRVRTAARGRPRSARVAAERIVEGVLLTDASGKPLVQCPKDCNAEEISKQINDVTDIKLRVRVPKAYKTATPGGAFAGVQKAEADFYNDLTVNNDTSRAVPALTIEVFNDYGDKSRFVIDLAAVQSSSIYGISVLPAQDPGPPLDPVVPQVGPLTPPSTGLGTIAPTPSVAQPGLIPRIVRTALLLVRSPAEALLTSLLLMVFTGVFAIASRRRRLLASLSS